MQNDTPPQGDAALEAQRRKSNVYAFRRLKWGEPELRPRAASREQTRLRDRSGEKANPIRLPDNAARKPGLFHLTLLLVIVVAAGALVLVGANLLASGQL